MLQLQDEAELDAFLDDRLGPIYTLVRQLQGRVRFGNGSPEGIVDASKGVMWQRLDGTAGSLWFVKTTDRGTLTGWTAVA